jgi:hypothetical protein
LTIKINKDETIRDFKKILFDKTGVPEDFQVITEWYNEHFFKIFYNEKETIEQARIRKSDCLRMDELIDPSLNITEQPSQKFVNIALQEVQFIDWTPSSFGRKEMQTDFPRLLTISKTASLFDLRCRIAERHDIPFYNINLAFFSSFPIYDSQMNVITFITNSFIEKHSMITNNEDEDIEIEILPENENNEDLLLAYQKARKENRDGKSFNFRVEKQITLQSIEDIRDLSIVCWEDLRLTSPKEKNSIKNIRNKKIRIRSFTKN